MDAPIPVTILTGFLGAGKSTLLEQWLGELPADTVVIVNEQGDIGIDGALLSARASRIVEITGGCVCCTTYAALDAALADFAASKPTPSRIVVETSGAASPAGVIRALTWGTARQELRLDGVITVIDAARARTAMKFGLTIEQLGFADVVVMSHVDQCIEAEVLALHDDLAAYAPAAVFARARAGRLEGAQAQTLLELLAEREGALRVMPSNDDHIAHHGIKAVSLVHDGELDEEHLGSWVEGTLGTIEVRISRIKGILAVRGIDQRVILQGVGEAIEVTLGPTWGDEARSSRMVILGLDLDREALRAGFAACTIESVGGDATELAGHAPRDVH
ncbi:MAG: GTP-binding protein [Deltaproteobacteria bacterium]|nr:GTP-binding protein [Deltaproteobacteria bacterium]